MMNNTTRIHTNSTARGTTHEWTIVPRREKRGRDGEGIPDPETKRPPEHPLARRGAGVLLVCEETREMLLVQGKASQDPCLPTDAGAHPYFHKPSGTTRHWRYINEGAKWGPPKGRFDEETDEDDLRNTAVRELREETGIVILADDLRDDLCVQVGLDRIFIVRVERDVREMPLREITPDSETFAIAWHTFGSARRLWSNRHLRECLRNSVVQRYCHVA